MPRARHNSFGKNLWRPYGTRIFLDDYPALKRWANIYRAYGARVGQVEQTDPSTRDRSTRKNGESEKREAARFG